MRTRTVEFSVAEAPELSPGMFARIDLELESIPDAVIVPREAVLVTPAGGTVAFVFQNGKVAQRKVKVGIESDGLIQILSGIAPGEKVVTAGNEKLKDGSAVRLPGASGKPDAAAQPAQSGKKGE
jgi:membrane fusion protein (multidrug efflux system)